ncbi:MAG: hypothetical protein QOE45_2017 [Frankiaceae bacterium]|jgi:hypothetical protein|nr:hypothetical protein [Frankiaceae bacterium]
MPPERCLRCGTARRGDLQVCVRCETPFEPAEDVDLALPRPAAPSPSQSHGTVMIALIGGFVLMGVLLAWSVRGVGPFQGRLVSVTPVAGKTVVTVAVTNDGRKAGRAKCRVHRIGTSGDAAPEFAFLSQRVAPHATETETVEVPDADGATVAQVSC